MSLICKAVTGIGFGFFSDEEIRKLSVKQITVPYVFDNLNQPVPGGLYDRALGPMQQFDTCPTCSLDYKDCLGHMGHIELAVPVYHPLLFTYLYKLLRAMCFCCHRVRASRLKVKKLIATLMLIDCGLLLEAKDIDNLIIARGAANAASMILSGGKKKKASAKKGKDKAKAKTPSKRRGSEFIDDEAEEAEEDEEEREEQEEDGNEQEQEDAAVDAEDDSQPFDELTMMQKIDAAIRLAERTRAAMTRPYRPTKNDNDFRRAVLHNFFREIPSGPCANCNGISPKLRRDGYHKIFKMPLSAVAEKKNLAAGVVIPDVMGVQGNDLAKIMAEYQAAAAKKLELEEKRRQRLRAEWEAKLKKKKEEAGSDQQRQPMDVGDDDEEEEERAADDAPAPDDVAAEERLKKRRKGDELYDTETDAEDEEMPPVQPAPAGPAAPAMPATAPASAAKARGKSSLAQLQMPVLMFPNEVEKHMELLWSKEPELMALLWGNMAALDGLPGQWQKSNWRIFFLRVVAVPPSRFRPPARLNGKMFDHAQNIFLKRILEHNQVINEQRGIKQGVLGANKDKDDQRENEAYIDYNKVAQAWLELQLDVNGLMDQTKSNRRDDPNGIRQLLEKKHGLFRMHMMGKRVNFAARSVISPDPFIHTKEVGVPEFIAKELTYPEPVTPHNVHELRQAVINGPFKHPGANYIIDENGNKIDLSTRSKKERIALSRTLLTSSLQPVMAADGHKEHHTALGVKKVLRHLRNGDILLANRQPTLHKPSIMAHYARILKGQQTLRLHYANCNTYNADFDGDEMNLHFPQNELARAEAYLIVNTDNQYPKPTDGMPLRGLIQDHVVSGVLLTKKDTFFTPEEYMQLLYAPCQDVFAQPFEIPPPAILKPKPLYTGKQVITAILNQLGTARGKVPFNLDSKAKIPGSLWGKHTEEGDVIIRQNELLTGVLDKNQFGASAFGLVHSVYELWGPESAGDLLSTLGRLFTIFLQSHGFTCGIDDMLLVSSTEKARQKHNRKVLEEGTKVTEEWAAPKKTETVQDAMRRKLSDPKLHEELDAVMGTYLNEETSKVSKLCLPDGQYKPFPANCMHLMTASGAKGGPVNFTQISALLGQMALEGRRVPVMVSGKTLPSFAKYDPSPRAGGYITQRFLTGIKPQEYYFHCMAGREGLVDTAVKTSRAGYLQRCLIKHLESLRVAYDYTVRDNDGSVIQFKYGEDSIDVSKSAHLDRFNFLQSNYQAMLHKLRVQEVPKYLSKRTDAKEYLKRQLKGDPACADPVLSKFPPSFIGAQSDKFIEKVRQYIAKDPDGHFKGDPKKKAHFEALMQLNYMRCTAEPGESVGILVAQSIGEPATQMTLNTFHLAGHGSVNVTLGLPRLREIIMTASETIKTPVMELPLLPHVDMDQAVETARKISRLKMADFITDISVRDGMSQDGMFRLYVIRVSFAEKGSEARKQHKLKWKEFQNAFEHQFVRKLNMRITKELKDIQKEEGWVLGAAAAPAATTKKRKRDDGKEKKGEKEEEEGKGRRKKPLPGSEEAAEMEEAAAEPKKKKKKKSDDDEEGDYDDPDEEDKEIIERLERQEEVESLLEEEGGGDEEELAGEEEDEDAKAKRLAAKEEDLKSLLSKCQYIDSVRYDDSDKEAWAEVVVKVDLSYRRLLMMSAVETIADQVLLRYTPGISRANVTKRNNPDTKKEELVLQVDGLSFSEVYKKLYGVVDLNRIYTNDIIAVLRTYGVEAARSSIVDEIQRVFKVYGISVSARHLNLLADYMTFSGRCTALNRIGLDMNSSPFQKICFETSVTYMTNACINGEVDWMTSPSARLVMGLPIAQGTGICQPMQKLSLHGTEQQ